MPLTNIPNERLTGRSVLRTDLTEFTAATLKADLERLLPQHAYNMGQIRKLQEYVRGWHPGIENRVKTTRTDIDNKITVNLAWSTTRDIVGYFLGKPIQYTNRKGTWRQQMENLVSVMNAENKALVDYQIAWDCSICGVGYRGIFDEAQPRNGTHMKLLRLDPLYTFVVYPTDPTKPVAYAVAFYDTAADTGVVAASSTGATRYYKVYTPTKMFVFKDETVNGNDPLTGAQLDFVSETPILFGGGLPIVEYQNNLWRMGDWETCITLMDALDAVVSDGVNDIQQAVNSILVAMGVEFKDGDFEKISTNGFLNVANIPPGLKPIVEFISQPMDASIGIAMREYLEATFRVIVGVPDRKTRDGGGGDTGDAVFMRDGWQDLDLVATSKEAYFIQSEREALQVMLYILDTHKEVSRIKPLDIDIHFNRHKTSNIQSKAQVYQTLTTGDNPLAPVDALDIANLTNNVHDVILRAESFAAEMQKRRTEEAKAQLKDPNSKQGGSSAAGDDGKTA